MVLKNAGLSSYFFWGYGCRTVRTHMERVFLRSLLTYGQRCSFREMVLRKTRSRAPPTRWSS